MCSNCFAFLGGGGTKTPPGNFYWVWSTSKLGKDSECNKQLDLMIKDASQSSAFGAKGKDAGMWCHIVFPCKRGDNLVIFSLWEAKPGKTPAELDKFIAENGILNKPKLFNHTIWKVNSGKAYGGLDGTPVPSKFDTKAKQAEWNSLFLDLDSSIVKKTGRKTFAADLEEAGAIKCDGKPSWYVIWHSARPGTESTMYTVADQLRQDLKTSVGGWSSVQLNRGMFAASTFPVYECGTSIGATRFCIWQIRGDLPLEKVDEQFFADDGVFPAFYSSNFFKVDERIGQPFPPKFVDKAMSDMEALSQTRATVMTD